MSCPLIIINRGAIAPLPPHFPRAWWVYTATEVCAVHTHTTHNHFTALLESVWDYPGEQVPER